MPTCPHFLHDVPITACTICNGKDTTRHLSPQEVAPVKRGKSIPVAPPVETLKASDVIEDLPGDWMAAAIAGKADPRGHTPKCELCPSRAPKPGAQVWAVTDDAPTGKFVRKVHDATHRGWRGKQLCDDCCHGRCRKCIKPRAVVSQMRDRAGDIAMAGRR